MPEGQRKWHAELSVSCLSMCVCVCVLRREVEPQIAFNWRLKLSDSQRLSCHSRCSHHGDASQRSAPLTTSGNGWLWRTARERVQRHTGRQDDRDTGQRPNTHLQTDVWHTGKRTWARGGTHLRELEWKHAGKANYFGGIDMLHCILAPGQSNHLPVKGKQATLWWDRDGPREGVWPHLKDMAG